MGTRQIAVPGGLLYVVDEGDGPPIVLLHAGVADLRSWDGLAPHLATAGYRVVRYDSRGFGRSTTDDVEFSGRADLVAVLDALRIERAALVGNSRGGSLAFDAAIERPDRVVAVVGVGAGLSGYDGGDTPAELAIFDEQEHIDRAEPFDAAALTAFETSMWVDGPGQSPSRVAREVRDLVYEMNLPLNTAGWVGGKAQQLEPPAVDRLAELRCPVLAIAGQLDFSGVAATARKLESEAPDARAVIWPDVAHMIGMEVPDRLGRTIVDFLAPLGRWS